MMHEVHPPDAEQGRVWGRPLEFRGRNSAKSALRQLPALNLSRSKYISIPMRFAKPHLRLPIPTYYFGADHLPTVLV